MSSFSCLGIAAETQLPDGIAAIAHRWASISYRTPEKDREAALKGLAATAEQLVRNSPGKAEPMVWDAIVLASYAKAEGGLDALTKLQQARNLLLAAEKIDPNALNGSIYTSLGSLYAKVPGWPLSFGDAHKARAYLQLALKINPNDIDAQYFYGDFLATQGEYAQALDHLKQALAAPPRSGREDADAGRRQEIVALITEIQTKYGNSSANSLH